jgi:hypothetical protein
LADLADFLADLADLANLIDLNDLTDFLADFADFAAFEGASEGELVLVLRRRVVVAFLPAPLKALLLVVGDANA